MLYERIIICSFYDKIATINRTASFCHFGDIRYWYPSIIDKYTWRIYQIGINIIGFFLLFIIIDNLRNIYFAKTNYHTMNMRL